MPKISRTCHTPGCLQENQSVVTGMRECIYCGRTMDVPEPSDKEKSLPAALGDFSGLSSWYLVDLED